MFHWTHICQDIRQTSKTNQKSSFELRVILSVVTVSFHKPGVAAPLHNIIHKNPIPLNYFDRN